MLHLSFFLIVPEEEKFIPGLFSENTEKTQELHRFATKAP